MHMTRFCAIEVIAEPWRRSIGLWWDILVIAVFNLVIVSLQPHRRRDAEDGRR